MVDCFTLTTAASLVPYMRDFGQAALQKTRFLRNVDQISLR